MSSPLMSTFERYLPVLPVTVMVKVLLTSFVVEMAVIVHVCDDSSPSDPPASRPVTIPVSFSTQAMLGSDDSQIISVMSPTSGTILVGTS